jgi:hypothetical protein
MNLRRLFLLAALYVLAFHLISDDTRHKVFHTIFNSIGHPEYTTAG